jgi:hypothetical protein
MRRRRSAIGDMIYRHLDEVPDRYKWQDNEYNKQTRVSNQ